MLGDALAERQHWRPALDAMRIALSQRETADLRARYVKLRGEHGFRVLELFRRLRRGRPRAGFQFSEELPKKAADFSPFVAIERQDRPDRSPVPGRLIGRAVAAPILFDALRGPAFPRRRCRNRRKARFCQRCQAAATITALQSGAGRGRLGAPIMCPPDGARLEHTAGDEPLVVKIAGGRGPL